MVAPPHRGRGVTSPRVYVSRVRHRRPRPALSAFLGASILLAGCASAAAQTRTREATLVITGSPAHHARELTLVATLTNRATTAWSVPVDALSIAQLSVDVLDASGHRVPTIPPPVPPAHPRLEPLAPGASRTFRVVLGVFSPDLPVGTYTVTWGASDGIAATPATFQIVP